ncbi:MAG: zinc-dependent metalloprotease [Bacteroidetes bacterium]|nr:zinc-dependent metalloprotease [Bacteroidota bacterium]
MKKLMMMTLLGLCGVMNTQAQDKCGAQMIKDAIIAQNPSNALLLKQQEELIKQRADAFQREMEGVKMKTTSTVTVPVVFHIILTATQQTALGGISGIEERVYNQIQVLNDDYAKLNADTTFIPAPFKPVAGGSQIHFGLAHRKPDGSSTPGYEIRTTTTASYSFPASGAKYTNQGGLDAWDPSLYLNVWVINLGSSILGFTVPRSLLFSFPSQELGVVITHGAFGKRTAATTPYFINGIDKGRTLTHEVGHYFELEHIWGDDNGLCPNNGGQDDGIADTPPQANSSSGVPVFPKYDACSPTYPGIMFMNYMDYSNDTALYMFTNDQVARMHSNILPVNAQDYTLGIHPELLDWPTGVANIKADNNFLLYPNPSTGKVTISLAAGTGLQQIEIVNLLGKTVFSTQAQNNQTNYNIDLSSLSRGMYVVRCVFKDRIQTQKLIVE